MGSADNKKAKKRKNRKASKVASSSTSKSSTQNLSSPAISSSPSATSLKMAPINSLAPSQLGATSVVSHEVSERDIKEIEEIQIEQIQKLMDAEDEAEPPLPPLSRGPNPYLGGDRCLLCHCERPNPPGKAASDEQEAEEEEDNTGIGSLSQLPLWVCPECRKTVEEEEKRHQTLEQDLRIDSQVSPLVSDLAAVGAEALASNVCKVSVCTCDTCMEKRRRDADHDREVQELAKAWIDVQHVVRYIYRETGTGLSENEDSESYSGPDSSKIKTLVHRLLVKDAHQLFQRLETLAREYVLEVRARLLKQLGSGASTPPEALQFVTMLLEEYSNLCAAAKKLASYLSELETEHLKRFNLTWELHNKHLFHSLIYTYQPIQSTQPMLMSHLRLGVTAKDTFHEDTYPNILHRYLDFGNQMAVVSVVWRDCEQLLGEYNEEQEALRAKQKMLKEDWEFFKQQRKILEQQVLKNQVPSSTAHSLEVQFTETMRNILQGTKPSGEECLCPNCNRKRCPCDECTISHMITCGIISPELTETMPPHAPALYPQSLSGDASRYIIDVRPPSMSSTSSSSGSESPITIEAERLTLPFEANFDVADEMSEIPTEIECDIDGDEGTDDDNDDKNEKKEYSTPTGGEQIEEDRFIDSGEGSDGLDDEDDDDYDEDDDEDNDEDYKDAGDGLTEERKDDADGQEDADDEGEDDDDDEEGGEDAAMKTILEECVGRTVSTAGLPIASLPLLPVLPKTDPSVTCDCSHCAMQASAVQQLKSSMEENTNQCQCHACLRQSGKSVATSLPQHVPVAPRPAALHLYPHIHGSGTIHPGLHGHANHVRPILQPQLYELHTPMRGTATSTGTGAASAAKTLVQPTAQKKAHNLNLSELDAEALQDHIYPYTDWDSSYNSKMFLTTHKFGSALSSELFSSVTPPLLNAALNPEVVSSCSNSSVKMSPVLQHCASAASSGSVTSLPATLPASVTTNLLHSTSQADHPPLLTPDELQTEAQLKELKALNQALLAQSQTPSHNLPSVVIPASTSGTFTTSGSAATMSVPNSQSSTPITSPHNICLKSSSYLWKHHITLNGTQHSLPAAQPLVSHEHALKLNSDLLQGSVGGYQSVREEAGYALAAGITNITNLPQSCAHSTASSVTTPTTSVVQFTAGKTSTAASTSATTLGASIGLPATATTASTAYQTAVAGSLLNPAVPISLPNSNVSVGTTTTTCSEPNCDGAHDENYDSGEESCSGQSSSTSASNQKEGKYCDCCYCEFFGHSTPPSLPTSKNYAEMRDKLRLRLKKKQTEAKGDDRCDKHRCKAAEKITEEQAGSDRSLDELIRFIEGAENADSPKRSKAAKRARQKQRKAEEKAKKDAEEAKAKAVAAAKALEQRQAMERLQMLEKVLQQQQQKRQEEQEQHRQQQQQKFQQQVQRELKRKKGKHKDQLEDPFTGHVIGHSLGPPLPHPPLCAQQLVTVASLLSASNKSKANAQRCHATSSTHSAATTTTKNHVIPGKAATSTPKDEVPILVVPSVSVPKGGNKNQPETVNSPRLEKKRRKQQQSQEQAPAHQNHTTQVKTTSRSTPSTSCGGSGDGKTMDNTTQPTPKSSAKANTAAHGTKQPSSSQPPTPNQASKRQNQTQQGRAVESSKSQQSSAGKTSKSQQPHSSSSANAHAPPSEPVNQPKPSQTTRPNSQQAQATRSNSQHKQSQSLPVGKTEHRHGKAEARPESGKGSQPQQAESPAQHKPHDDHNKKKNAKKQQQATSNQPHQGNQQSTSQVNGAHSAPPAISSSKAQTKSQNTQSAPASTNQHTKVTVKQKAPIENGFIRHDDKMKEQKKAEPVTPHMQDKMVPPGDQQSVRNVDTGAGVKNKKNKRKNKGQDDMSVDEIFMPKQDVERTEMDEVERELEEFKRFCMETPQHQKREKLQVNMNMKDIFNKKKSNCV